MSQLKERSGVLAGGNWIIDHVKIIDRYPSQDTLANISSQYIGTGGSPYNILLDLAKLGATFPLEGVGLVGDDADGQTILEDCRTYGIDASQVHTVKGAVTSYTDVMTVRETGRRTFFHMRGANSQLASEHFDLASSNARIFQLGYLLLLDVMDAIDSDGMTNAAHVLREAVSLGMETSIDAVSEDSDRFAAVVGPTLPFVDYLIINEIEAGRTTGIPTVTDNRTNFKAIGKAAERLLELGVRQWVVIHAAEGALAMSRDGRSAVQGCVRVPPENIAGSAGAGDAFAAGALLGFHEHWDIRDCLQLAVTAAASSLYDPTCTGGVLSAQECLSLGDKMGYRMIDIP